MLSAAFSPGGSRTVTVFDDKPARIWDAAIGNEIARITLDATVRALAIFGDAIALGAGLSCIHVFDAGTLLTAGSPRA